MSRIIVKNLPDKITKEKLLEIFSQKGTITDVQLKYTKDGKFRKFAFIGFKNSENAEDAKMSFNNSFINTSQIQVETCAELGDPKKPRAWSKYAPENSDKKRQLEPTTNESKVKKLKKVEKDKINDSKIIEVLKNHENDPQFTEYMETIAPELSSDVHLKDSSKIEAKNTVELANENISDLEYIKLKTGSNVNLKCNLPEKVDKKSKSIELFTVKLSGLPLKVKKGQIKSFLSPLKPFTVRRALKIKGVAYCGFKTEKEMKISLLKNRTFLGDKQIFVSVVKNKHEVVDSETEKKWEREKEEVKGLETVAESGRIFARNLPYTATEEDLKSFFEKYGPLSDIIFPIDSFTRKPKGFAIVTFLMPEHAWKAFSSLDGTIFQGRMLHLLPGHPSKSTEPETDNDSGDSFKKKKLKKEKANSNSSSTWNTFFIGENATAEAIAASYETTKEAVLDDTEGRAAVRLALGETQLVNQMKTFLEENDVCVEAFENLSQGPRSKTVILVKNLPFGTKPEEIKEKFSKFGELKRVVLPPGGVAALVEFIEPSEAKIAFRRTCYSKFKHLPMYLEWAPERAFINCEKSQIDKTSNPESSQPSNETAALDKSQEDNKNESIQEDIPREDGCVIFVKNLNFSTEDDVLKKHFLTCGDVVSATIARKKNTSQSGKKLSSGYGFVEFARKEYADKALKTLQFSNLDGYKIELKRSNRTVKPEFAGQRKVSKNNNPISAKILVKNIPFQATQKEINELFKVFGEIKAIRLPKKMIGTGLHRGFCFVEYNTVDDAKRAIKALSQSTHLYGRRLVLEWAAADDDVATLRQKTAQQFKTGTAEKKKNITVEEDSEENNIQ